MLDPIFNLYKIKYQDLNNLLIGNCKELNSKSKIDVFINLEMIMRKFLTKPFLDYMATSRVDKHLAFISNIVNLAAHYRAFFTKNKHYNRIFLYIPYPFNIDFTNEYHIPKYRSSYKRKFYEDLNNGNLTLTLNNAIPLAKTILEYIDGVYLLYSNEIEPSVIPYIIYKEFNRSDIRLIITNDIYDFQYVNIEGFYPIRKSKGYSAIITEDNLMSMSKMEQAYYNENIIGYNKHISCILSVIGNKKRDIPSIPNYAMGNTLKALNKGVEEKIITPDTDNINLLAQVFPEQLISDIVRNYLCTDVKTQYESYKSYYKRLIESQLLDRFDNDSLREIADKFIEYPLMVYEMNNYDPYAYKHNILYR